MQFLLNVFNRFDFVQKECENDCSRKTLKL